MRKLHAEISKLKNLLGKSKNSLDGLSTRVSVAEDKTSEMQDEMQKTSRNSRINKKQIRQVWQKFKQSNIRLIMVSDEQESSFDEEAIIKNTVLRNFQSCRAIMHL